MDYCVICGSIVPEGNACVYKLYTGGCWAREAGNRALSWKKKVDIWGKDRKNKTEE